MTRYVIINVVSGEAKPWTFYYIYRYDGIFVASLRGQSDLGWRLGQLHGMKDGKFVDFIAAVRTRTSGTRWSSVYICKGFLVIDPLLKDSYSNVELIDVRVEDA